MHPSLKRLLGTILLIALVTVYPFLVLLFAVALMPQLGGVGQFFFYAVAGLIWVPPAGLIITWMHGGRKSRKGR